MSVAFTREEDYEAQAADLPDRPISHHANLVTSEGLKAIDDALAQARSAYADAQTAGGVSTDRTAMARATRDLRYWSARRASAQLTEPALTPGQVQFGRTVHIERDDGRKQAFRIVGEDEADPAAGKTPTCRPWRRRFWAGSWAMSSRRRAQRWKSSRSTRDGSRRTQQPPRPLSKSIF